jgi:phosphatidylglycerophosphatase A
VSADAENREFDAVTPSGVGAKEPATAGKSGAAGKPATAGKSATAGKPRIALFFATACGLGYLPKAPGTWGSLGGLVVVTAAAIYASTIPFGDFRRDYDPFIHLAVFLATCVIGVWSASRAARFWGEKDPQRVVIDEVSGQYLTIMVGCGLPYYVTPRIFEIGSLGNITWHSALNWKNLLLGLILFRLFDIWKPFPARQAESLPGGWGIMADDWVAGMYAAILLWIARVAGL